LERNGAFLWVPFLRVDFYRSKAELRFTPVSQPNILWIVTTHPSSPGSYDGTETLSVARFVE
jgi:hypothetical protein